MNTILFAIQCCLDFTKRTIINAIIKKIFIYVILNLKDTLCLNEIIIFNKNFKTFRNYSKTLKKKLTFKTKNFRIIYFLISILKSVRMFVFFYFIYIFLLLVHYCNSIFTRVAQSLQSLFKIEPLNLLLPNLHWTFALCSFKI